METILSQSVSRKCLVIVRCKIAIGYIKHRQTKVVFFFNFTFLKLTEFQNFQS